MTTRLCPLLALSSLLFLGSPASGETTDEEKPSPAAGPTPAQVDWLRTTGIPFTGPEAGQGFEDLEPLRDMIADARIVGLGECTHGTREVFQMKHRLVEFLATEMGFTIFSIEASTPEAYALNDFVLHGEGDPAALIAGMYFWTWNTEEVLDMVLWMREFNESGKGRIEFTGFDMQYPNVAAGIVTRFLEEVDPELAVAVDNVYKEIKETQRKLGSFGVATYTFPIEDARGKHVTYRGHIKTEALEDGWAGLWWRVDGENRATLGFDNMKTRGPRGTSDWTEYTVELDVPEEAVNINFGVLMPGQGKAWFDGLTIELDGEPYTDTDFDLDFEGTEVKGYHSRGDAYLASLDPTEVLTGTQSLKLESLEVPPEEEGPDPEDSARKAKEVRDELEKHRDAYLEQRSAREVDWVIHNAKIVQQSMEMRAGTGDRDESMAENVAWIAEQNPDARIVLWAHNAHIARRDGMMGDHLAERFGTAYLPVGFLTSEGSYYAMGGMTRVHDLADPPAGSVERFFEGTGEPRLILDARSSREGSDASGWVRESRLMRSIGAMAMDEQFFPGRTFPEFDLLVYLQETSAARQLATTPRRTR